MIFHKILVKFCGLREKNIFSLQFNISYLILLYIETNISFLYKYNVRTLNKRVSNIILGTKAVKF